MVTSSGGYPSGGVKARRAKLGGGLFFGGCVANFLLTKIKDSRARTKSNASAQTIPTMAPVGNGFADEFKLLVWLVGMGGCVGMANWHSLPLNPVLQEQSPAVVHCPFPEQAVTLTSGTTNM